MQKRIDNYFEYQSKGDWFSDATKIGIDYFDVIFLRIDRPITDKQLLDLKINNSEKIILNDPNGIIHTGSKKFLLNYPDLCPGIKLIQSTHELELAIKGSPQVLKPLFGYGGHGIVYASLENFMIGDNRISYEEGISYVRDILKEQKELVSMTYMENVDKGDKRVIVVGDEVIGAILRIPAEGSWLCNLKQGGSAKFAEITDSEFHIAERISPTLRKYGVLIFGFDTLEDENGTRVLSEINTLNVGGLLQAQQQSGKPVIKKSVEQIMDFLQKTYEII
jgi:glutathione synthase